MGKTKVALLSGFALASLSSSVALASRVPSDTPNIVGVNACHDLTVTCPATGLFTELTASLPDNTLLNNIYVYDEGIVSINGPLPSGADLSNPSTLGTSFLAPGVIPGGSYGVQCLLPGLQ